MAKKVYALTYVDNVDGYSETVAVSFDENKLTEYCKNNEIDLDSDNPQYHEINSVSFLE